MKTELEFLRYELERLYDFKNRPAFKIPLGIFEDIEERIKELNLDAPCVVCGKAEEVDSGMCEDCFQEAQGWANEELKYQNSKKEKGCGKKVGNWKCGTIFNDEIHGKKVFLCLECEKSTFPVPTKKENELK